MAGLDHLLPDGKTIVRNLKENQMLESVELDKIPFLPDPSMESIFQSAQLKEAERRLLFAAQAKAICLLTGEPGAGKTTVLRVVGNKLRTQGHRVLYTN